MLRSRHQGDSAPDFIRSAISGRLDHPQEAIMSEDARGVVVLASVSDVSAPHRVLHFLYVPDSDAANAIASELRQGGFCTEERLAADGVSWLVLAHHEIVPTGEQLAALRRSMENLVAPYGGEYDGWEAEVPPRH
jgi:hypothetical protein